MLSSFTSLLSLGRYYYQCLQGPLSFNETAGDKTCKRYFSIPAVPCSLREASVESSQVQCYLPAFMASRKNHLLFLRISFKPKKWSFVIKPTELDIQRVTDLCHRYTKQQVYLDLTFSETQVLRCMSGCTQATGTTELKHGITMKENITQCYKKKYSGFCENQIKRIQFYSQKSQSLNHCDPNLDQLLLMQLELLFHPTVQYIKNINSVCVKALCFITKNILPFSIGWRPNHLATATTIIISLNSGNEEDVCKKISFPWL